MISNRRWISFRTSAEDKPLGNLGNKGVVFIVKAHKITAYILSNALHLVYNSYPFQENCITIMQMAKR
jgi:hypothetical protein